MFDTASSNRVVSHPTQLYENRTEAQEEEEEAAQPPRTTRTRKSLNLSADQQSAYLFIWKIKRILANEIDMSERNEAALWNFCFYPIIRMWDLWQWTKNLVFLLIPIKWILINLSSFVSHWIGNHPSLATPPPSKSSQPPTKRLKSLKEMPGPWPSLPFIGTAWIYWFGSYSLNKLHKANYDKYKKYGKIMKEEFAHNCPLVQLFDPKDIEIVLKHQGRCPIRPANEPMAKFRREHPQKYNSVGLVNAQGEEWYQLRARLTPILVRQKTLQQYLPAINEILDDFLSLVEAVKNDKDEVEDTISILYRLSLEVVLMVCLETRLGCLDPDLKPNSEAHQMIESAYNMFEAFQDLYFGPPLWKYMETKAYRKMANAENVAYGIASKYIDQAIEQAKELKASSCLDEKERGLTILMDLISQDDLDPRDVRMIMVDFIVAGIDTVATTVLFLLYHLARNPQVQEKLYKELETMIPYQDAVTSKALAHLPYLKACVKESFRLSPTIPNAVRILPEDTVIQDYCIPAGTPICCHTMVTSQLSEYFENPHSFVPERWIERKNHHPCAMLPFGFGSRMCIGHRIAEQEIQVTVAKIIQKYQLDCKDEELECVYRFMIVPENPLSIQFKERKLI